MNFEQFINFSDFIANPTEAIKKAQRLMENAVQEEKIQLEAKAKAQEDASRASYQAALQALKQQYDQMREAAGLNALQKRIEASQVTAADNAVANLQNEVERLRKENEKLKQEKAKNEETVERVKEKAKENAPKSGRAAYDKMKDFYDSDASAATKDKVRFLPSDEALEYIAQLDAGLTPEEIEQMDLEEIREEEDTTTQKDNFWGFL